MTKATERRIRRLYENTIGYDPCDPGGGWTPQEALEILREFRIEARAEYAAAVVATA